MSADVAVLVLIVGLGLAALLVAVVWAVVDNLWIYKRRVPPEDEHQDGVAAEAPSETTGSVRRDGRPRRGG